MDDEQDILEMLKTVLTASGYEVLITVDGLQGLKIAKAELPDLILLDVTMPEIDGFEVLKRLKKDKKTTRIPVIMLTGRSEPEDVSDGIRNYADKYLVKPVDFDILRREITRTLDILQK